MMNRYWKMLTTTAAVLSCASIGGAALPYDVALGKTVKATPAVPQTVTQVWTDGADTRDVSMTQKVAGWPEECADTTTSMVVDLGKATAKINGILVDCLASQKMTPPAIPAVGMRASVSADGAAWQELGVLRADSQLPNDPANRVTEWTLGDVLAPDDTRYVKIDIDWKADVKGQKLISEVRVLTEVPPINMRGTFYFIEGKEKWTRARFAQELDWMRQAGVDSLILMRMIHDNKAFYPTKLSGYKRLTDTDPFDYILSEASKRKMDVYVHLTDAGDYWSVTEAPYYDELSKKLMAVADDAHRLYGKYSALKGFYLIPEFWYPAHRALPEIWVNHYLQPVTEHLKALNPKYVICSAPFVGEEPDFKAAGHEAFWTDVMTRVPGLDFIAIQDGIGANEHPNGDSKARTYSYIQEIFTSAFRSMDKTGRELWCDLESFEKVFTPFPQHFSRFVDQMNASGPIVGDRFFTFEWAYLSPSHSLSSLIWHQNVQRHRAGEKIWENLSHGASYFLTNRGLVPDTGLIGGDISTYTPTAMLTANGGQDVATTETAVRLNRPTRCEITLPTRHTDIEAFAVSFANNPDNAAAWPQKITVEISDDAAKWKFAGEFGAPVNKDVKIGNQGLLTLTTLVSAKYVRFNIFPAENHEAYCSDVAVLGYGEQVLTHNRPYKLSHTPGDRFPDPNGKLTNGDYSQRGYAQVGWRNMTEPVTVEFDLETTRALAGVDAWFLRKDVEPGDYPVNLPEGAAVLLSYDGVKWSEPSVLQGPGECRTKDRESNRYSVSFDGQSARYVRLTVQPSISSKSWLNISEVKIYGTGKKK